MKGEDLTKILESASSERSRVSSRTKEDPPGDVIDLCSGSDIEIEDKQPKEKTKTAAASRDGKRPPNDGKKKSSVDKSEGVDH